MVWWTLDAGVAFSVFAWRLWMTADAQRLSQRTLDIGLQTS
jgi:hypothetical protein